VVSSTTDGVSDEAISVSRFDTEADK